MWSVREAIVVEGRYDVIRLSTLVDAVVVATNGFRIFKDREQCALLRRLAAQRGVVVLTDSDAAGFVIRDHISAIVPKEQIKHAYIPPIVGKESRKRVASKEGLVGVEGMRDEALCKALRDAGVIEGVSPRAPFMSTVRLYEDGLTGHPESKRRRQALCERLMLPTYLSTARLIAVLNAAYNEEEYLAALAAI